MIMDAALTNVRRQISPDCYSSSPTFYRIPSNPSPTVCPLTPTTEGSATRNQPSYNKESVRIILTLLLLAPILAAQDRAQFVWQGEVDGIDVLYLHGNHLNVQAKEGAPATRQQFNFYDHLPDSRQNARLEVREGRGFVHIIDQPRIENHYTLAVSIEDRQPGSSFYSIALFWDASNQALERGSGRTDKLAWSGRVDQEAVISCQSKTCSSAADGGAPVAEEKFKFSRPLPQRDVEVTLEDAEGRGEIHLAEQPRERNHYTARVSIRDPQSGSGEYSFTLVWKRPSGKDSPAPVLEAQRGLLWSGVVDRQARVTIKGSSSISEILGGAPITGERVDFLRPMPARSDITPVIKKLSGAGRVEISEYPSEKNNYRLVFEITNSETSPARYEIEVDW